MEIKTIILMSIILVPLILFIFFRRFLDEQKYQKYIKLIFHALAAFGIVMVLLKGESQKYFLSLLSPLFSYWTYRLCFFWFRKKMGRDPIDTAYDWSTGLKWDRLFNIGYVIIGIVIPFVITVLIVT